MYVWIVISRSVTERMLGRIKVEYGGEEKTVGDVLQEICQTVKILKSPIMCEEPFGEALREDISLTTITSLRQRRKILYVRAHDDIYTTDGKF